jgi:hypothetical protein
VVTAHETARLRTKLEASTGVREHTLCTCHLATRHVPQAHTHTPSPLFILLLLSALSHEQAKPTHDQHAPFSLVARQAKLTTQASQGPSRPSKQASKLTKQAKQASKQAGKCASELKRSWRRQSVSTIVAQQGPDQPNTPQSSIKSKSEARRAQQHRTCNIRVRARTSVSCAWKHFQNNLSISNTLSAAPPLAKFLPL